MFVDIGGFLIEKREYFFVILKFFFECLYIDSFYGLEVILKRNS